MYDKAVEYISGGSNVPEIKEFFWKWRRHHQPQHRRRRWRATSHNLALQQADNGCRTSASSATASSRSWTGRLACKALRGERSDRLGMLGNARRLRDEPWRDAGSRRLPKRCRWRRATARRRLPTPPVPQIRARQRRRRPAAGQPQSSKPTVRTNFADTALWTGGADHRRGRPGRGRARHAGEPDHLEGQGLGHGARHARSARARPRSSPRRTCIVRLQAPRFFVAEGRGRAVAPTSTTTSRTRRRSRSALELEGGYAGGRSGRRPGQPTRMIEVAANGEQRVDWRVKVTQRGRGHRPHEGADRRRVGRHAR